MASRPTSSLGVGKTYFEQQREMLIGDIAMVNPPTTYLSLPRRPLTVELDHEGIWEETADAE